MASGVISSAGRIGGMALSGVLIGITGPAALFLINVVSSWAVIGALLAMRLGDMRPLATSTSANGGNISGFRYPLKQPVILSVLALSLVLGSLGRNYQVSMAAMVSGPRA